MATFHLHARIFRGTLLAPERDELQTRESDDYDEAQRLARQLASRGFAVWIYEHGPARSHGESGYRVIAEWGSDGVRRPGPGPTREPRGEQG